MVDLPITLARAAPISWQVGWSDDRPVLKKKRSKMLVFAILRQLLSPNDLILLYEIEDGELWKVDPRPSTCLLSVRGGLPRTLQIRRVNSRGRKTVAEQSDLDLQRKLNEFEVPPWIKGTRLCFQNGRWCVAPPAPSRKKYREWNTRLAKLKKKPGEHAHKIAKLEREISNSKNVVFTAVSRLLCFAKHGHPNDDPEFVDEPASEVLAVHHACEGSRQARARCLNVSHIAWGTHTDNAYHRVMHGALTDGTIEKYELPAEERRPEDWYPPSRHPGFVRERKRLSENGSRRLYFD